MRLRLLPPLPGQHCPHAIFPTRAHLIVSMLCLVEWVAAATYLLVHGDWLPVYMAFSGSVKFFPLGIERHIYEAPK